MKCKPDPEIINSAMLGLSFMFVYSAFYTLSNLEKLILHSVSLDDPDFTADPFVSLSLLYVTFALFIWLCPPVMSYIGTKGALTVGTMGFCVLLGCLLSENSWLLYLGSVCTGVGSALLWTSQGVYMIMNSTSATITRNTAIFSALCHSSMLYGNTIVYFSFAGRTSLDRATRQLVLSCLLGLTVVAVVFALLLPAPRSTASDPPCLLPSPLAAMKESWVVARTRRMLILCPMFLYCGLQISFLSGVFGAAVAFTTYSDGFVSNQLVAVTGFFTGIGEILAEIFLVSVSPLLPNRPYARGLIIFTGITSNWIAFFFCFLNFANDAVFSPTNSPAIINSCRRGRNELSESSTIYERTEQSRRGRMPKRKRGNSWLAVVTALLLGFSDGIFMPMLISLVGKIYPGGNASALTIYTFCFALASAASFFYSSYIGLHWQLLILALEGIIGGSCYAYINREVWT